MANKNPVIPKHPKVGRQNALCERCKTGDHSGEHNRGVGCVEVVQWAPYDYVCECPLTRSDIISHVKNRGRE